MAGLFVFLFSSALVLFYFLQGGKLYFTECVWSTGILILSVKCGRKHSFVQKVRGDAREALLS